MQQNIQSTVLGRCFFDTRKERENLEWSIGPFELGGKNWWVNGRVEGRNECITIGCANAKPGCDWDNSNIPNKTPYIDCIKPLHLFDRLRGLSYQDKRRRAIERAKRWIEKNTFEGGGLL